MPKQVDDLALEADEMHKKLYPEQYGIPADTPPDPVGPPPGDTPPSGPGSPTPPKPDEPPVTPDPAAPPPGPPSDQPPAPPSPPPAPPAIDDSPWEAKYKVLQGKYDAEVPRLSAEVSNLKTELTKAIGVIQTHTQAPPADTTPPAPAVDPKQKEVLDSFKNDYPDIFEATQLLAQDAVKQAVSAVQGSIQEIKTSQSNVSSTQFHKDLADQVPDWQTVKDDPGFAAWLNQPDEYSGVTRYDLAVHAMQSLDAKRVAKFYTGYKSTLSPSPTPPPPTPPPAAPSAGPTTPGKADMSVAPPRSSGQPGPPASTQPETISSATIQKFYQDAARGLYAGRDAEFASIEAKINDAVIKGNVIG